MNIICKNRKTFAYTQFFEISSCYVMVLIPFDKGTRRRFDLPLFDALIFVMQTEIDRKSLIE